MAPTGPLTVCRELTKLHEEIRKTTIGAANIYYKQNAPRGEFVLVMARRPAGPAAGGAHAGPGGRTGLGACSGAGHAAFRRGKQAAAGTPFSKSEIYKACLEIPQAAQKEGAE